MTSKEPFPFMGGVLYFTAVPVTGSRQWCVGFVVADQAVNGGCYQH